MELSISLLLQAIYLLFTASVLLKIIFWLMNYMYRWQMVNKMPGLPVTIPFVGNLHYLKGRKELLNIISNFSRDLKQHQVWRIWLGWKPIFIIHKAESLDVLMSSTKNTAKSYEYKFLHPWLGEGLLTSYGDKWQVRRRMITPAFHFEILDDFLHVMNEQAEILIDTLIKESKTEKEINIFKKMALCTLDVICETAMGQNVNAQIDKDSEYVKTTAKISELIVHRMFRPYFWSDFIYSKTSYGREHKKCLEMLHQFTRRVILQREADFEANEFAFFSKRAAFLDILLKAKHDDPTITFDDIQEEVDTFMFEGHDTTAAAASWACHLIGSHPEVQKKLHEEIDRVLGNTNRPLTKEDLKELDYLDCVIKETLRMFPSVPFFGRFISEDCEIDKYKVLKGDTAVILAYMVHRDEKYYPEPEKFNPDRFLPENSKDRHPYAYIPFSAGRRNCIGQRFAVMEEKVLLANVLRKFEITSLKTTEELNPVSDLITRPLNGIPVKLTFRS